VIGKPIFNIEGRIELLRGTIMDINERKLSEIRLQQQNEELMKINAEMDRFVYSVSHNLRAPLTSILGLINISRLTTDKAAHDNYLDMMEKSIFKLDATIHEINEYSKNARLDLQTEYIQLKLLFREIIDELAFIPEAKNIEIVLDISDTACLWSDKSRLKAIFTNLLSNAINYHHIQKEHPFIKISARPEAASIAIIIEDNGSGIANEHKDKIFNMFYRASAKSAGSGLGLYIVKESINKLNGTIQVTSEYTQGTAFTLTIPCSYSM
jgi:signal transduction histidine kinase